LLDTISFMAMTSRSCDRTVSETSLWNTEFASQVFAFRFNLVKPIGRLTTVRHSFPGSSPLRAQVRAPFAPPTRSGSRPPRSRPMHLPLHLPPQLRPRSAGRNVREVCAGLQCFAMAETAAAHRCLQRCPTPLPRCCPDVAQRAHRRLRQAQNQHAQPPGSSRRGSAPAGDRAQM
jgi:hypothetical protein